LKLERLYGQLDIFVTKYYELSKVSRQQVNHWAIYHVRKSLFMWL